MKGKSCPVKAMDLLMSGLEILYNVLILRL